MIFAGSSNFVPNPCEMLAVNVPSIAPLWYSRKTPKRKRHQAYLSSNKRNEGEGWLQTFARNKNEQTAERCVDQCYPRKAHECAFVEEFPVMQISMDSFAEAART